VFALLFRARVIPWLTFVALVFASCGTTGSTSPTSVTTAPTTGSTSAVAATPAAAGSPANGSIPYTDVNPYGVNTFMEREVEAVKNDKTADLLKQAHIGWIKQQFLWAGIETSKGHLDWTKWDGIVDRMNSRGIKVIARLDYTPGWAQKRANPNAPPDNPADYAEFVFQFTKHYAGRVAAVQIWNEPNLSVEWGGQPPNAQAYVNLLKLSYARAKAGDPNVIVLSAPLAETLERSPKALTETEYLQQMYDAGARSVFDVLSANAYGLGFPPDDPPTADRLNFLRFTFLHDVMVKNGDANKAIWFNEYGWNASPKDMAPEKMIWSRVTREQQATYTTDGIKLAREKYPYVGVINIWYFRQVGDTPPTESSYYFDMVAPDYTINPVYTAVQQSAANGVGMRK